MEHDPHEGDPNRDPMRLGTPPLPAIPPRLTEDLRALYTGQVPDEVSRRVLMDSRRELERGEVRRRSRFRLQRLVAAAAGVALFVLVARLVSVRGPGPTPPRPVGDLQVFDVTADGRVTILDAFRLARLLEGGDPAGGWDANGDGTVSRADVDAIAMRAVRLEGAG